ncbi:N-acyl-L-amino acid amidohydrolase [Planktosalinus lacus]|uniref:N-acyl-L-amino acid amidohydrolase n=1 Tax=Planktosalinus lacus TaxID=1526573 RepID=A0A8J2VAC7_9FLAO|nr:N-acyl-L-amino acid amidohydrolase [Planktosalinus lacus]
MDAQLLKDVEAIEQKVIDWRHHFHQFPELSNREFKTAEKIAEHLKTLGLDVQTGIAHSGVVGILKGNQPGKVVALRADIDALPVTERNNLPFKSEVTTTFLGSETGVMHACGHDTHAAILMGVAEILTKHKHLLNGTVKFIFQPAEERPPPGENGGAKMMVEEGVLSNPDVDAIFGLHISSQLPVGSIAYRPGGIMAAADSYTIVVNGKGSHGSTPWTSVDPILISAKIIDGLQTIVSRESELTKEAVVITIGKISAGTRQNIIPESAEMLGTLRTLDHEMREKVMKRMDEMVTAIAKAYGGEATLSFHDYNYPITYNDPELTTKMLPTLKNIAGNENVVLIDAITGAEDFSFFQKEVPGLYFFLGGMTPGNTTPYPHHTPDFMIDDSGMLLG